MNAHLSETNGNPIVIPLGNKDRIKRYDGRDFALEDPGFAYFVGGEAFYEYVEAVPVVMS